jgi:hypothetical protein
MLLACRLRQRLLEGLALFVCPIALCVAEPPIQLCLAPREEPLICLFVGRFGHLLRHLALPLQ